MFFHPDTDWKRVRNHIPHGIGITLLSATLILFPIAWCFLKVFISYEENEDLHKKDQAWNDYLGVLFGIAIMGLILFAALIVIAIFLLT